MNPHRLFGLWASNGPNPDLARMLDVAGEGAYTVIHEGEGARQAREIRRRWPEAEILVRFHNPDWLTTEPVSYANFVASRMTTDYAEPDGAPITRRVVAANEPNLEPTNDFGRARFVKFGQWYERVAIRLRQIEPRLVIHFPAFAAGHDEDTVTAEGWAGLIVPAVLEALWSCDYINYHCYWHPEDGGLQEMSGPGRFGGGLRYRVGQRLLRMRAGLDMPVWIDEAGPFGDPTKIEQIAAHSRACQRDGAFVTYFLWADPTNNPGNTINQWWGRLTDAQLDQMRQLWGGIEAEGIEPGEGEATDPPPEEPEPTPGLIRDLWTDLPRHANKVFPVRSLDDITDVVIHHVGIEAAVSPERIAQYHIEERDWPGAAYHFYVRRDGSMFQLNPMTNATYHAFSPTNERSIAICLEGDLREGKQNPTPAQLSGLRYVFSYLSRHPGLRRGLRIGPHKDQPGNSTACPGNYWWYEFAGRMEGGNAFVPT